jgi:hypothetical protein
MRFLLIEAYAKLNAWKRRNIFYIQRNTSMKQYYKMSLRNLQNTSLGFNKMLDKLYINIDDVYAWNLFDYKFLVTTILTAIAHLI